MSWKKVSSNEPYHNNFMVNYYNRDISRDKRARKNVKYMRYELTPWLITADDSGSNSKRRESGT